MGTRRPAQLMRVAGLRTAGRALTRHSHAAQWGNAPSWIPPRPCLPRALVTRRPPAAPVRRRKKIRRQQPALKAEPVRPDTRPHGQEMTKGEQCEWHKRNGTRAVFFDMFPEP